MRTPSTRFFTHTVTIQPVAYTKGRSYDASSAPDPANPPVTYKAWVSRGMVAPNEENGSTQVVDGYRVAVLSPTDPGADYGWYVTWTDPAPSRTLVVQGPSYLIAGGSWGMNCLETRG